jgi:hypothetical protein
MAIKTFDSKRRTMILAIGLLLAAILVAGALLQQNNNTKVYLVANRDLAAGTQLSAQDVRLAELNLGAESDSYLAGFSAGTVLVNSVPAGELIPSRATTASLSPETKPVRVSPSQPLSTRIRVGSRIQLWFVPKAVSSDTVVTAIQLLGNAEVLAVHKGEQSMGTTIDDIEIAVPIDNLTAVITAIASAGFVSVVSES